MLLVVRHCPSCTDMGLQWVGLLSLHLHHLVTRARRVLVSHPLRIILKVRRLNLLSKRQFRVLARPRTCILRGRDLSRRRRSTASRIQRPHRRMRRHRVRWLPSSSHVSISPHLSLCSHSFLFIHVVFSFSCCQFVGAKRRPAC